jgi:hypothetical protein
LNSEKVINPTVPDANTTTALSSSVIFVPMLQRAGLAQRSVVAPA